jgi:hypothetical protein
MLARFIVRLASEREPGHEVNRETDRLSVATERKSRFRRLRRYCSQPRTEGKARLHLNRRNSPHPSSERQAGVQALRFRTLTAAKAETASQKKRLSEDGPEANARFQVRLDRSHKPRTY